LPRQEGFAGFFGEEVRRVELLLSLLAFSMVFLAGVLYLERRGEEAALRSALDSLGRVVQTAETRAALLQEKLARLENLPETVGTVGVEVRVLAERVQAVEQHQQTTARLLAEAGVTTQGLKEIAAAIQADLSRAKEGVAELRAQAKARQELAQQTAESIKRLEAIMAGTHTKGAAGENILELDFAKLPLSVLWRCRARYTTYAVVFALLFFSGPGNFK